MGEARKADAICVAILREALQRKRVVRPGYSKSALAREIGVSPAFVTNLLNGAKKPPKERLEKICRALELDIHERAALIRSVVLNRYTARAITARAINQISGDGLNQHKRRKSVPPSKSGLLSAWWLMPVLEGLSLEAPYNDPEAIKTRLNITKEQMAQAIEILLENGLIEKNSGRYVLKEDHLYIPTGRSRSEVRTFHDQMILKARHELTSKTSDEHFHRRLITASTFAVNSHKLESVKRQILNFLSELAREASNDICDEVFQCNSQFFPLTKPVIG